MTERELGDLQARLAALERDMRAMRTDVREIRDALLRLNGGKKVLIALIAAAGSLGAWLASWLPSAFR